MELFTQELSIVEVEPQKSEEKKSRKKKDDKEDCVSNGSDDKSRKSKKEDDDLVDKSKPKAKAKAKKEEEDDVDNCIVDDKPKPKAKAKPKKEEDNEDELKNFKKYFNETHFTINDNIKLPSFEIPRGKLLPQRLPKICAHGDLCSNPNCNKLHLNKIVDESSDLQSLCLALIYYGAAAERDARYEERVTTPK